jgi:DNA-directed RNA polymerase specialized sigma24 family protein
MATKKEPKQQRHKILREAYRHLDQFKALATDSNPDPASGKYGQSGRVINAQYGGLKDVIEYKGIELSYFDLKDALNKAQLAPRKREAFYYNVLLDMKQRDVAEIMKITTVSVGQYVEQAMLQIAEVYFKDEDSQLEKIEE